MPVLGEIGYQGDFTYEMQNYLKDVPPALYLPALTFARMTGEHLITLSKTTKINEIVRIKVFKRNYKEKADYS